MKTAGQYFNEFPEPYRTQAIINVPSEDINKQYNNPKIALLESFVWENTPEGDEYWREFMEDLIEKEPTIIARENPQEKYSYLYISKGKEVKKFYHNFKHNNREITLCLLVEEYLGVSDIKVGYSICVPEDKYDRELGKKIALGRAQKDKLLGSESLEEHLALDNGVLKAIAWYYENRVKKGELEIKGIR